ncbi:sugar porter family MFS transporter [Bacteroides hominis]|uniref:sugar porter family MFS transporter n=1 Tax=Bacteroides hominis TaxID=2763023 RepID=UPI003D6C3258
MNRENKPLFLYTFITVFGGLIVGLNMAGISGAVPFLQEQFMLDDMALGLVVSILTVGCLCGALLGGGFSDRYGRQKVMFSSAIFFIVSSLGCALAVNLVSLLVFRLICGLGIGVISAVAPIYISEISPARLRGTLVSYNQLAVVIGILIAYIVDYILLDYERNWRLMLGFPFFFSVAYLLLLVILPESPRWLSARGKADRARQVASKLNLEAGEMTVSDTNTQEGRDRIKVTELFKGNLAKVVFIGSILAALQQITGINVIINYAPSIFEMTGVAGDIALVQSILVGVVNLLFTLIAVWLVDKVGRKILLLGGSLGMSLSLLYLVYTFVVPAANGIGALIAVLCYIGFFAASLAPLMWVVTSEIYPSRIRGTAMSLSTGVSWLCTFLTVQFFPWILNNLGGSVAFGIFAVFSIAAFAFILFCVPETKGKSLEAIEKELGVDKEAERTAKEEHAFSKI